MTVQIWSKKEEKQNICRYTHNRARVIKRWAAFREVGHLEENVYNGTHYSTEMMMWGSAVPSHLENPTSLPLLPSYTFSLSSVCVCLCVFLWSARPQACLCVCVCDTAACVSLCVCVCVVDLEGNLPFKFMHLIKNMHTWTHYYSHMHPHAGQFWGQLWSCCIFTFSI